VSLKVTVATLISREEPTGVLLDLDAEARD
jgi:hypothetical protein